MKIPGVHFPVVVFSDKFLVSRRPPSCHLDFRGFPARHLHGPRCKLHRNETDRFSMCEVAAVTSTIRCVCSLRAPMDHLHHRTHPADRPFVFAELACLLSPSDSALSFGLVAGKPVDVRSRFWSVDQDC